jgi:hypothetical protein
MGDSQGIAHRIDLSRIECKGGSKQLSDISTPIDCDPNKVMTSKDCLRYIFAENLITVLYYYHAPEKIDEPGLAFIKWQHGKATYGKEDIYISKDLEVQLRDSSLDTKYQCMVSKHLRSGIVCVGMFQRIAPRDSKNLIPVKKVLVFGCYRWSCADNSMKLIAKSSHEIDLVRWAANPNYTRVADAGYHYINFIEKKGKIFGLANMHPNKQILEVYCMHKKSFIPVGGSNCGLAGVYLFPRNEEIYFFFQLKTSKPHSVGLGCISKIDMKNRVMELISREYTLTF